MKFEPPAKLRIPGMAIGVETGDDDSVSDIVERCREAGLLLASADVLTMFPPLTVGEKTANRALTILERSIVP